ncbi:probable alpha-(1,3)-fucosyltransferase 10 [Coccomyxa sp. Obi]|nr:probable alpha-(1,3)-fucosyltransferase 10 [Coccomyxa sp. Obi]
MGVNNAVLISVMTPHQFIGGFEGNISGCMWHGQPLGCQFVVPRRNPELHMQSDALFYHGPNLCMANNFRRVRVVKSNNRQLAVMMTMEASTNYPSFDDPVFMDQFDLEMSYRRESQLPVSYLREDQVESWSHDPLVPFEERSDSPVYVQSNCQTMSGRDARVRRLMEFHDLGIRSFGGCLNTEGNSGTKEDKIDIYRRHKICIVIENSLVTDYVTEKLYDAFVAGCVPLYLGAPNIADVLPDPEAIIDYRKFGSTAMLRKEILRVSGSKSVWESKVAWRRRPLDQLNPNFQAQVQRTKGPSMQCQLCSMLQDVLAGNRSLVQQFRSGWQYRSEVQKEMEMSMLVSKLAETLELPWP